MNKKIQSNEPSGVESEFTIRSRQLEDIRSLILANPEWETKIGPLCLIDGHEILIDLLLALSSESLPMESMRDQGAEMMSSEIPDDLGNGKVITIAPHRELDERFQIALHSLYEEFLEISCLVHFSWIHQKGQKFTEQTEAALRRLSEFRCRFGKTGVIGPSSKEEMDRIFGSIPAKKQIYNKSTPRIMKKLRSKDSSP